MAVSAATILARIREHLTEATARFWADSTSQGLIEWYDEGAYKQHRIVFDAADKAGVLLTPSNEYVRYFLKSSTGNLVAGTPDYALPADYWRYMVRIELGTSPDIAVATPAILEDDWKIRNLPHWAPTIDRPRFTLVPSAAATAKVRLYVYGNNTVPNTTDAYVMWYYRDVIATGANSNVDVPDPFNEGPIAYAVAQAMLKLRHDPTLWYTKFNDCAMNIVKPPQSAQVEPAQAKVKP